MTEPDVSALAVALVTATLADDDDQVVHLLRELITDPQTAATALTTLARATASTCKAIGRLAERDNAGQHVWASYALLTARRIWGVEP